MARSQPIPFRFCPGCSSKVEWKRVRDPDGGSYLDLDCPHCHLTMVVDEATVNRVIPGG